MRTSQYLIATLKETPADAEIISHQLMLRAGLVRKLAAGLYTWLPLGLRVLHKVTDIIRTEMDNSGALEISMPVVQPADLWRESERWDQMGPELLRFVDRHERDFCLGPTHEEVITDMVRSEISSYKQLPINFYQIQTKFRDERRPRFGIIRTREFIMKDAYSFHLSQESLQQTYDLMYQTYSAIFTRLGLKFRVVIADTGNIGGSASHEFHVLADSGEDEIVFSSDGVYAANIEMAQGTPVDIEKSDSAPNKEKSIQVDTEGAHTIVDVSALLGIAENRIIKTLIVMGEDKTGEQSDSLIALVLRGDQELNTTKAEKLSGVASPLEFASEEQIVQATGCKPGSLGPIALPMRVIADLSVEYMTNFVCGANQDGKHLSNANWGLDCKYHEVADFRTVKNGDLSPDGKATLSTMRGIEVGHIFQLGKKYSESMNATVLDKNGKAQAMSMGCYGIGVTRIVAACIEQCHDQHGILWPDNIAPFHIVIIPLNAHKSEQVKTYSDQLYSQLQAQGYDVLLDDRDKKVSAGVKFADMELIGIPHRVVVSDRNLEAGVLEYKNRRENEKQLVKLEDAVEFLSSKIVLN